MQEQLDGLLQQPTKGSFDLTTMSVHKLTFFVFLQVLVGNKNLVTLIPDSQIPWHNYAIRHIFQSPSHHLFQIKQNNEKRHHTRLISAHFSGTDQSIEKYP